MPVIRAKQMSKSMEGDYLLSGSISVFGTATFTQTSSVYPAITISGSQEVVPVVNAFSGSVYIQGLGTFADTGSNEIIDLGDESF